MNKNQRHWILKPKIWRCECGFENKITYDVKVKLKRWLNAKCKKCGTKRIDH